MEASLVMVSSLEVLTVWKEGNRCYFCTVEDSCYEISSKITSARD